MHSVYLRTVFNSGSYIIIVTQVVPKTYSVEGEVARGKVWGIVPGGNVPRRRACG